jgi:hypothetical protein
MGVARGAAAIRPQLDELKTFIQACSDAVASFSSEPLPAWSAMRPSQRAMALKVFRRSEVSFREQLNRVEELRCGVVNDSARQAAFLTGMQKKYGAKAVRRAGVLDVDMREVAAKISGTIASLAASTASAGPGGPGPAPVEHTTDDTSFMSLNTPTEQLAEWTEVDPGTIEDPYAALVAYGMCGFPVRMAHTAAVQMDPWQTACLDVEPYLVDSGSLLLANRMQQVVMGPTRQPIVDVLVTVHPQCEVASCAAARSVVNHYLCSVALCRDLYMFQPGMVPSLHAHAFLKAMDKYSSTDKSSAYLKLALHLPYSLRVLHDGAGMYSGLLKHWLQEWGTLTTANADGCKHPAQAVIALATATATGHEATADWGMYAVPLLTLLCEVVSRACRGLIKGGGVVPTQVLGAMYGIDASNSPVATEDAMAPEPDTDTVRRSCPAAHDLRPEGFPSRTFHGAAGVHEWVRRIITPYYNAVRLGHVLQKLGVWDATEAASSVFAHQEAIAEELLILPDDPLIGMGISSDDSKRVLEAMFAQGMLYNDSDDRVGAGEEGGRLGDVRDHSCLHELLVDVHMVHYAESCEDKRRRWAASIGDVTEAVAIAADLQGFTSMVGAHTHGLSSKVFWSMVRAAKAAEARGDATKKLLFLSKSNTSVFSCFQDKKRAKSCS